MQDRDSWDFSEDTSGVQGPTPQDDDGWGQPSGDWGSDDDWGVPSQSSGVDDFGQDDFPQPGAQPGQQGSFIPQDDDGWGSTSGFDEQQLTPQPDQFPSDFAGSEAGVQEFQPRQFNLSMKKVAIIIAVVGFLVAMLFLGLDKIHFTKKPSNPQPTQPTQQTPSQDTTTTPQQPSVQQPDVNSVVLVEIPDSTSLDYNGDVLQANGTVTGKVKYVCGNQILYCINIGVAFGSASETVSYYGSYSSFNSVSVGDIVILKYQQVNANYISIVSVTK